MHDTVKIVDATPTMAAMFGYSLEEFIGQPLQKFVADQLPNNSSQYPTGRSEQITELSGLHRDGMSVPLEIRGRDVEVDGQVLRAISARNISARKLIEVALRSNEERFRQLTEVIQDVFWMANAELNQVIYVSPAYETIWGRSCNSLYENPSEIFNAVHPDDRKLFQETFLAVLEQTNEGECRIIRPDNSIRWIWLRTFPISNELGVAYRIAGVAEDITRRKEVEFALHEGEAAIRALYEIAAAQHKSFSSRIEALLAMGCQRFDTPFGLLSRINDDRFEIIGVQAPANGVNVGDAFSLSDTYCEATVKSRAPIAINHAGVSHWRSHPCYSNYRVESYIGTPVIVHGNLYGSLCFYSEQPRQEDFSSNDKDLLQLMAQWISGELEQQQAEAELERQYHIMSRAQSESRAIFDATSEAMALVSTQGDFLSINRRFSEIFALAPVDVIGKPSRAFKFYMEQVFADPTVFMQRFNPNKQILDQVEDVLVQVYPERRELSIFATPVYDQSVLIGRLYVIRDVTREREVDRMKSEFVSMVSHELRTPLTSIKGYLDIVLEGEAGPIQPAQAEFLSTVKSNADRLMILINDLLDIARIESGKIELVRKPQSIVSIIRSVVTSLRPQINAKHQTLTLCADDTIPMVCCDKNSIVQIMTNLLSNAYKYTPDQGTITVCVRNTNAGVVIDITDNGIGISTEDQAQLFNKFFRARQVTKEFSGTGLGLAISQELTKLHGGSLEVSSVLHQGSTFTVTLPTLPLLLEATA